MSDITDPIDENPIAGALGHTDHHKKLAKKANALGDLVTTGRLSEPELSAAIADAVDAAPFLPATAGTPTDGQLLGFDADGNPIPVDTIVIDATALGLENVDNTRDANKPVSTPQQAALDGKRDKLPAVTTATQRYILPVAGNLVSTNGALGNGTLRLAPFVVDRPLKIDRIGAEITTAGEAGSTVRLGIYADNGNRYPGSLLVDAGTIDAATVGGQTLTITPLTLPPGVYWIGAVVQGAPTTQPTLRVATNSWTPPFPLDMGQSAPSNGAVAIGYSMTGVSAALPGSFSSTLTTQTTIPRLWVRNAA